MKLNCPRMEEESLSGLCNGIFPLRVECANLSCLSLQGRKGTRTVGRAWRAAGLWLRLPGTHFLPTIPADTRQELTTLLSQTSSYHLTLKHPFKSPSQPQKKHILITFLTQTTVYFTITTQDINLCS